ncbi:hypothetical protein ACSBR2_001474 [Camellia fascicularis]
MYRDRDRDRDRDWSSRSKRRRRDHVYWVSGGILSRVSSAMALNAPYLLKLFLREKHAVQAIMGMLKSSVKAWNFGAAKLIGRLIINPDNEPFILPFGPQKCDLWESSLAKVRSQRRNVSNFRCPSPDYEIKETKIIYVDSNESLNGTEGTNSVIVVNGEWTSTNN